MKNLGRYRVRKTLFETLDHSTRQIHIDQAGFIGITFKEIQTKVYSAQLASILSTENIPVIEQGTRIEMLINPFEFIDTYADGFKEGIIFFNKTFGVTPDTLYGINADKFVRDIHMNYVHIKHKANFEGWKSVRETYPRLISHAVIRDYGYFGGILSEADNMIKTYPIIFSNYDKCSVINDVPTKSYSYTAYAMALNLKNILVNKKGVGVTDGMNYIEKFNLKPGQTLYNKLNAIINEKLVNPKSFMEAAHKIIKQYNL